jgi:hypothetical protein
MPQRGFDAAPDATHRTACITHVISLLIAGFSLSEVRLEVEDGMQAQRRVRVDGIQGGRLCCVCVDGLV